MITKNRKIAAVGMISLLAAGGLGAAYAQDNNDDKLSFEMEKYNDNEEEYDYDDYYEEVEIEEFLDELSPVSQEVANPIIEEIQTLELQIDELYENNSQEFETLENEALTLFDEYVALSDEEFKEQFSSYENQFEELENKYITLEEKVGIIELDEKIDDLYMDLELVYTREHGELFFDENEYLEYEPVELSENEEKELEALYDEEDKIYNENADKFEELEMKYENAQSEEEFERIDREYEQLEEKSGLVALWEKIESYFE